MLLITLILNNVNACFFWLENYAINVRNWKSWVEALLTDNPLNTARFISTLHFLCKTYWLTPRGCWICLWLASPTLAYLQCLLSQVDLCAYQNKATYSQTHLCQLYLLMCLWSVIKCHINQENTSMKRKRAIESIKIIWILWKDLINISN